ncbi:hypothetical protein [Thaumasiovibrio subtropicus]|uniref:hypothetical protein n=1 Tax=Thaumasiovibrio subtropicus TaxID=1891207 RepID=UPI000B35EE52|nr:hypothetical protein [Thaumasiovibrio subtropicus]
MEDKNTPVCQFNYEQFLSHALQNKVDFSDVIRELFTTNQDPDFYTGAMHSLSISYSDTDNIVRLIKVAQRHGIYNLDVILPYALEERQIQIIQDECQCRVENKVDYQDKLIVTLYDKTQA